MKCKLDNVQKYIIDGALSLWVEAFNQERKETKGKNKISLFGENYADLMADDIRKELNIEKGE
jgi:hypothetical protein